MAQNCNKVNVYFFDPPAGPIEPMQHYPNLSYNKYWSKITSCQMWNLSRYLYEPPVQSPFFVGSSYF